jgi:hypothetical protein
MLLGLIYDLVPTASVLAAATKVADTNGIEGLGLAVASGIGAAAVVARAVEKVWPSKSDSSLAAISKTLDESLKTQQQMVMSLAMISKEQEETRKDVATVSNTLNTNVAVATQIAEVRAKKKAGG